MLLARPSRFPYLVLLGLCGLFVSGCATRQMTVRTSSLEFLYPKGAEAVEPSDVTLQIPVRVGIAFAPEQGGARTSVPRPRLEALLERVAAAFEDRDTIASIDVIPTTYLRPQGGFDNLDQVRAAFGVDLIVLVSYEQAQFTASTGRSIAYWTIVGAYVVNGQKNETSTVLEAVVYDIRSRALLFRASGNSNTGGRATAVGADRRTREFSAEGFEQAADDLIVQLDKGLAVFEEQARQGTVRGVGTPDVRIVDASGAPYAGGTESGAGALGAVEWVLLAALACGALRANALRRRSS